MFLNVFKYVLEQCKRCGCDVVPIWYRDEKSGKLCTSNGKCVSCDKPIVMDDMTKDEFVSRVREGLM